MSNLFPFKIFYYIIQSICYKLQLCAAQSNFPIFFPSFFGEVFLCFWFKIIFEGGLIAVGGRVDLVPPQIPTTKDDFPFFCVLLICIKIPSNCRMCVVFKQMRSSSSNHFENLAVLEVLDSVVYIRNSSINGYD